MITKWEILTNKSKNTELKSAVDRMKTSLSNDQEKFRKGIYGRYAKQLIDEADELLRPALVKWLEKYSC